MNEYWQDIQKSLDADKAKYKVGDIVYIHGKPKNPGRILRFTDAPKYHLGSAQYYFAVVKTYNGKEEEWGVNHIKFLHTLVEETEKKAVNHRKRLTEMQNEKQEEKENQNS